MRRGSPARWMLSLVGFSLGCPVYYDVEPPASGDPSSTAATGATSTDPSASHGSADETTGAGAPGPVTERLAACGEQVVDLTIDPNHCGACFEACPGDQRCSAGACASSCDEGLEACGRSCADLSWSRWHCGQCDSQCPLEDMVCAGGLCFECDETCNAPGWICTADGCACHPELVECGDRCVDPSSDAASCGACDTPCTDGRCDAGVCIAGPCSTGRVECDGGCVDLLRNPLHCGTCGAPCESAQFCIAGECTDLS